MKRRGFLTGGAVAAGSAVAASTLPRPALGAGRRKLSLVTSWPKDFPGLGEAANRFAHSVAQLSEDRITVQVFAGGDKAHALKCNDAVQQGTADLYHSADHYYGGKSAAYMFFTGVPFGLTGPETAAWIDHGGGQAIWDAVGAEFGVKHLRCGHTGAPTGLWLVKAVKDIKDLKGLNIAAAGFGAEIIRALGGTPKMLAATEIQEALPKKTLDGADWAGPWPDAELGIQKSAKICLYPGLYQPGLNLSLGISRKLWDGLAPADRALLQAAAVQSDSWTAAAFSVRHAAALEKFAGEDSVELVRTDAKVTKFLAEAAGDALSKFGATDALSKRAYASFAAFRKRMTTWTKQADQPFLQSRNQLTI